MEFEVKGTPNVRRLIWLTEEGIISFVRPLQFENAPVSILCIEDPLLNDLIY